MIFKRMLGAFGIGGPSVDTVLTTRGALPGGEVAGEVRLQGGDFDASIEHVTLALVTGAEAEHGDGEHHGTIEFFRFEVSGPFTLAKGETRALPFRLTLPWEAPLTEAGGRPLPRMGVGVRTELAIAGAVDKGDLDPVAVTALPSQDAVLRGLDRLGFRAHSADVELGQLYGMRQELPFYQEIEYYPGAQHAGRVNELELTFVASPGGLTVIVEADKRGGGHGGDAIGRFDVTHEQAEQMDWAAELSSWLDAVPAGHVPGYGYDTHGGHRRHHDHDHDGGGMGGVLAAGALGVAGGLVAAEVVEEIFESDEDEGGDW
ncbi:sporulation protein [Nonomuraea sp. NBC_01738]|uniref:sporulation protein n=1 Tax=Nonomuraea sp. NBC_01738 TaxID=2976003 RepID=UPI002E0F9AD4|nr:sporulation protein [Nonomuraea sp. NBC_01738]